MHLKQAYPFERRGLAARFDLHDKLARNLKGFVASGHGEGDVISYNEAILVNLLDPKVGSARSIAKREENMYLPT